MQFIAGIGLMELDPIIYQFHVNCFYVSFEIQNIEEEEEKHSSTFVNVPKMILSK